MRRSIGYLSTLLLLGTAACGKETETPKPVAPTLPTTSATGAKPTEAAPSVLTSAELDEVEKSAKPYKLALIVKTRNNPFFDPMIKAAEAEAAAMGCTLEVQSPPQETDKERQFALVQDLTAKGVDAILITPADSKGVVPALKQAADKKIAVINLDNRVDAETAKSAGLELSGYVGAENLDGGQLAGKAMLEALGGKGKVAILEGIRGVDNAEARKNGFKKAVDGFLEVVASESAEWDTQKAYDKFTAMLAAHSDIQGVFCANDKMAVGALKAIQEAKKKVVVIGYDNIADVKPALSSGAMAATIEQHPDLMGKYGVRMAVGVLSGKLTKGREYKVDLEVIKGSKAP